MSMRGGAEMYVALLRAVNLAARNMVSSADLRQLFDQLGLHDPRPLLQSGNVVFRGTGTTPARLEHLLEHGARDRLGLTTAVFVRTADEWSTLIAGNPFREEAVRDPGHLVTMVLKEAPVAAAVAVARAAITGREVVHVKGRTAYIVYPDGIGRSRLPTVIEKALGTRGTGRNWNTVLKIRAALDVSAP